MSDCPLVSVIVPVYNVERYVTQCIESLLGQTLENIEVILINDGSTDGSLKLLREAESSDVRVKVIDKPNGGYGAAVNRGLDEAHGVYVAIAEPDDFVDSHMYEDLYSAARLDDGTLADIAKGSYWNYFDLPDAVPYLESPNLMNCMPSRPFCSNAFKEFEVLFHHPSIWSALYRREFLEEKGIRMIEPKGAGWADNPWFFETLLQAKNFVWIPAAYYFYRQTNPEASSNLRDYHLPFDRLRDIRSLFNRLRVKDPQVLACLYSRTFSYIGSVLGEFGFDDRDPELRALIFEALESMDPSILYSGLKGIRKEHLSYYELMTGRLPASVAHHEPVKEPRVSVIVPFHNDRGLLEGTLTALSRQSCEDMEINCVSCSSTDMSREIVEAYSGSDQRFRLFEAGSALLSSGLTVGIDNASSEFVAVVTPGTVPDSEHVSRLIRALDGKNADLVVCGKAFGSSGKGPGTKQDRALIACSKEFSLSSCVFRVDFLRSHEFAQMLNKGMRSGLAVGVGALCRAHEIVTTEGKAPARYGEQRRFGHRLDRDDYARYRSRIGQLDELSAALDGLGEDATRVMRCLSVRELLGCLRSFAGSRDGEKVFEDVRLRAEELYGIWDAPRSSFCNQDDFRALELALFSTYGDMLRRDVGRLRGSYWYMAERCVSLKESNSYRIGNALVRATKKVLPGQLYRKLRH